MRKNSKLRLLNALLAAGSPFANDVFADASGGIELAIRSGSADIDLEPFAKKILRLYDPDAHLEFLDFENVHFDPLFAFVAVSPRSANRSISRIWRLSSRILRVLPSTTSRLSSFDASAKFPKKPVAL